MKCSVFFVAVCFSTVPHAVDHTSHPPVLQIVLGVVAFLVLVVVAVVCFVRYRSRSGWYSFLKPRKEVCKKRDERLEMDVQQPENDIAEDPTVRLFQHIEQ